MAKPAKIKKEKDSAAAGGKASKPAAVKAKAKAEPKGNGKMTTKERKQAARQQAAGGLKGRLSRAPAKPAKGKQQAKQPQGNRAVKFLREVRNEMSKVTWPTREELIQATIAVVVAVIIAGVYIAIFDQIFSRIIGLFS